ncbi:60S ribosomal protein L2, mitochondrial [Capsicum chinense]|nr:60S ribosomal protein L2, mitochondrial [Capsicum chinense]
MQMGHFWAKSVCDSPWFQGWAQGLRVLWAKNHPGYAMEVGNYPIMVRLIFCGYFGRQMGEMVCMGRFGPNQDVIAHNFRGRLEFRVCCGLKIGQGMPERLGIIPVWWQETLGIVGASEHNESNPNTDQGSLPAKPIGEGMKDGTCKGNAHEALAEREGRMPMGAAFFEKARADSETSDLGLVMNEGLVVGLIKLAKPRFPLPFTYVVENSRRYSISDLTESMKLCFSCS